MSDIYLDYAAATPLDKRVLAAMEPYFSDQFYNPSAIYLKGRKARQTVEEARSCIARLIGSRTAEIIFTSGATEANNLALSGIKQSIPAGEILISAVEHDSVMAPGIKAGATIIPVDKSGRVEVNKLAGLLNDKTLLVSVQLINNETGTIQPVGEIAQLLEVLRKDRRRQGNKLPIYLHTDAAQAGNFMDLNVARLGVDLMSINGGKIYGPKQTGFLYVRAGTQISPLISGGGQEFGLRSGTENVAGSVGLAAAFELAQEERGNEVIRLTDLRHRLEAGVENIYPDAVINGGKKRGPHISSITFPGQDNERLMMQLDEMGVQVAVGSACSASNDEPSHVLKAMGLSDEEARGTLRLSLGRGTSQADIDGTLAKLSKIFA